MIMGSLILNHFMKSWGKIISRRWRRVWFDTPWILPRIWPKFFSAVSWPHPPRVSHVKGFILFKIEIQRVFEAYSLILQPSQRLSEPLPLGMNLWATANGIWYEGYWRVFGTISILQIVLITCMVFFIFRRCKKSKRKLLLCNVV